MEIGIELRTVELRPLRQSRLIPGRKGIRFEVEHISRHGLMPVGEPHDTGEATAPESRSVLDEEAAFLLDLLRPDCPSPQGRQRGREPGLSRAGAGMDNRSRPEWGRVGWRRDVWQ